MDSGSLSGRRVLVVEDEYMMASDLAEAFGRAGAEVLGPAPTVRQAVAILERTKDVHVAVLDVNLSGEMVYPLADLLLARGIKFLFTTGYDAGVIPRRFDASPRLEKPVGPADVVKATRRLIDGSGLD